MQTSLFSNLKSILIQYRWRLVGSALMIAVSNGLLIVNPLLFRQAVMAISHTRRRQQGTGQPTLEAMAWILSRIYLGVGRLAYRRGLSFRLFEIPHAFGLFFRQPRCGMRDAP